MLQLIKTITFSMIILALCGHAYHANVASIEYCKRQFDLNRVGPQTPYTQKKCALVFEKLTYEWKTGKYQ